MKVSNLLKLSVIAIPFFLTGCAEMLEASQNARAGLKSVLGNVSTDTDNTEITKDTPSKICQAYNENSVNALSYHGKKISFTAKANEIYHGGYAGVSFKVGKASIEYLTKDYAKVASLKKGKSYHATGIIREVGIETSYELKTDCRIILDGISIN